MFHLNLFFMMDIKQGGGGVVGPGAGVLFTYYNIISSM